MSITARFFLILFCLSTCVSHAQEDIKYPKNSNKKDEQERKQGHWIIYGIDRKQDGYADSSIVEEGDYVDDRKEGVWRKYNESGTLKISSEYRNNRPFDPQIYVPNSGQTKEYTSCDYPMQAEKKPFKPPYCGNPFFTYSYDKPTYYSRYSYAVPYFKTMSHFPLLYIGKNVDSLMINHFSFIYPTPEDSLTVSEHLNRPEFETLKPSSRNIVIHFTGDRFWVAQPCTFGQDSMIYQSASAVIIENISQNTIEVAHNMIPDMTLQYFDGQNWLNTPPNQPIMYLLPELEGKNVLFPGEIIVTGVMLYEGEHRKLRIVMGDYISQEFEIMYNQAKSEYRH